MNRKINNIIDSDMQLEIVDLQSESFAYASDGQESDVLFVLAITLRKMFMSNLI